MEAEDLSALEFLHYARKAAANSFDRSEFRRIARDLKQSPKNQQRLVFEFLAMTNRYIDSLEDPGELMLWIVNWRESVETERRIEYVTLLESFVERYFDSLQLDNSQRGGHPWKLTLAISLRAIKDFDCPRFYRLSSRLGSKVGDTSVEPRREILAGALEIVNQSADDEGSANA